MPACKHSCMISKDNVKNLEASKFAHQFLSLKDVMTQVKIQRDTRRQDTHLTSKQVSASTFSCEKQAVQVPSKF